MLTTEQVEAVLKQFTPTQEKIDLAVKTAIEVARPSRVILFGSWARGEARWDSDLDMAILMPDSDEPRLDQVRRALRRELDRVSMTIDLVMMTESIAHQYGDSIN
jgi:predicted nucleotidyltransferase